MTTTSHWRLAARQVIRRVLDGLPADMPEAQVRRELSVAYPFCQREHHPYRCWLSEVRLALGKASRKQRAQRGEVAYDVMPNLGRRPWWLLVRCDWCSECRHRLPNGCIMCAGKQSTIAELTGTEEFRQWRAAMVKDPNAAAVFADWLDDHGQEEIAEAFRLAHAEMAKCSAPAE